MSIHQPTYMEAGRARVISPDGSDQVPAQLWAEFAAITLLEPEPAMLQEWVANLEDHLNVHEAHRIALGQGQESALAYLREQKRRRLLERSQVASTQKMRDPELAAKVDAKLAELAVAMAAVPAPETKAGKRAAKMAQAKVRKLRAELAELQAQERGLLQLYGDAAEQIIRAKLRGEEVIAFEAETADFARDEHGAIIRHKKGSRRHMPVLVYDVALRAKKLVGIEYALAKGQLAGGSMGAERLYRAGDSYREAYVIVEGQTSTSGEGGGSGGAPKAPQTRLVQAGEELADMRRGLTERQRRVLDEVCGLDNLVWKVAEAMGAGVPATERALRGGLAAAADTLADGRQKRRDDGRESAAARVRRAHRMIARAAR